jgi:hypothetical protein
MQTNYIRGSFFNSGGGINILIKQEQNLLQVRVDKLKVSGNHSFAGPEQLILERGQLYF